MKRGTRRRRGTSALAVWAGLGGLALLGAGLLAGCVSQAKAKAQARAAYLAGQQDALTRLQQTQGQGPSVRINGPVRNPVVPWNQGLTLVKAILAADYAAPTDPGEIIVVHRGLASRVDVTRLLSGADVPLQPGDVVQIIPAPQAAAAPTPQINPGR